MRIPILTILLILPMISNVHAQNQDSVQNTNTVSRYIHFVDSLFIDRNPTHYSIRLFSSYKDRSFTLQNSSDQIRYTPNNKGGIGIGFANTKINIDLGINIKNDDDVTERFDFETNLTLNKSTIGLSIQHYKGYNLESASSPESIFREDISSLSMNVSYVRLFNSEQLSIGSIINGVSRQKKSAYSFGFGGVVGYNRTDADSSLVSISRRNDFNEFAEITNINEFGIMALGQLNGVLVLPYNLFLTASFVPGFGLSFKNVVTESDEYKPENPVVYSLGMRGALGFNFNRFYTLLSYDGIFGSSDLGYKNEMELRVNKFKFVVGYKLFNEKASSNN